MSINKPTLAGKALRLALQPAALVYGLGTYMRLSAYAREVIKQTRTSVPLLSIGNITCGGTGKTPLVIDIASKLSRAGYKPAILSRGYKRQSSAPYVVVSDGAKILASCQNAGDEPFLIATKCPGAVVIVGSKRKLTARIAIDEYSCDVILLDDGFQHLALARDLDLVLIDYNEDPERDALLPAGRLREPAAALARASAVVITKVPVNPDQKYLKKLGDFLHKHAPEAAIGMVRFQADHLVCLERNAEGIRPEPNANLQHKRIFAFCALAKPQTFFQSLAQLDASVTGTRAFADHHWYTENDLRRLEEEARSLSCDALVTTEKDLVKLVQFREQLTMPIFATSLSTNWVSGMPAYLEQLLAASLSLPNG